MRGPQDGELPGAVLFVCTLNAVRSPMAAAIMRHLVAGRVRVESAGVRAGALDPMAREVMAEIGIELEGHAPRSFEDLGEGSFDLIVSLSPEAHHRALGFVRGAAAAAEYWPTFDPTAVEGTREQRLAAYRMVRDNLMRHIRDRFDLRPVPGI